MKKNEILSVKIEDYTEEGFGVARASGYVLFVPGAVAGEKALVRVVKAGKNFGYAKLLELQETAPERIAPDCDLAGRCGGCAFRHVTYKEELRLKEERVRQSICRIGGLDVPVLPILAAAETERYRNKAQFPIRALRGVPCGGFYAPGSHGVVSGDDCRIQPAIFHEILRWVLDYMQKKDLPAYDEASGKGLIRHLYLREAQNGAQIMVCPVVNGNDFPLKESFAAEIAAAFPPIAAVAVNYNPKNTNVVLGERTETVFGTGYIEDVLCGKQFRIAPESFYQVNRAQTEILYRKAAEFADLREGDHLLDLYCGIGSVGLTMARAETRLTGVEIVPAAVENAKTNARLNGFENARFICADAGAAAARFAAESAATHGGINSMKTINA